MAELKLEQKLERLSKRAEALHDEVYQNIQREISNLEKSRVFTLLRNSEGKKPKKPGQIILIEEPGAICGIGLHHSVSNFKTDYEEYLDFKKNQEEKWREISPKDFFNWVVSHESGHIVQDKGNPYNLYVMYGNFGFDEREDQEKILRYKNAIREGFAYWFGDSFSGFKEFNPIRALTCMDKADVRLLKEMYEVYNNHETKYGRQFVIQHHEAIAVEYVKWGEKNSP